MFSNADTVQVEHVLEEKSYCEKNNFNTYSDEMLMEKVKETLSLFCGMWLNIVTLLVSNIQFQFQ